ncbi:MAG: PQQ-binding-like beta-propeller repeat protein [Gammaproteobacteria bacterium]|nr:PQQ-binding-like beta-propeller repeat protein [Gammaproteobacteria bacterium]
MLTSRKGTAWAGAGLLLSLMISSPTWADDVELLLSTPGLSAAARPNLLFILDSSGSMTGEVPTQPPYDPAVVYPGDCQSDMYYWKDGTSSWVPTCGSRYKFKKTKFDCAQGTAQIATSGRYADTMAMYREYDDDDWAWYTLSRYETDRNVECADDSGVHGENGDNATSRPYARSGTNRTNMYTSRSDREVNWGSWPTHRVITVYDPNWLNWRNGPTASNMRKTDIVKAVTKNVFGSMNNVNVGLMHFTGNYGGRVIFGLKDLDANRAAANAMVDALPAKGNTPLSETLYEAALYLRGMDADYGTVARPLYGDGTPVGAPVDTAALDTVSPMNYKQPVEYSCSKNFIVLLTDGLPTADQGTYGKITNLPGYTSVTGRTGCAGDDVNGQCLDDVAEYLAKADLNTSVDGVQSATTYTIGFGLPDDDQDEGATYLTEVAAAGGGKYFTATSVGDLTEALTEITSDIFNRDISFTAPAVAVNAFNRTQHLNDLYVSVFRAKDEVHWPGNMKKYVIKGVGIEDALENDAIDPDTGFFADDAKNFWNTTATPDGADVYKGGTANILPTPDDRKLYTNNGAESLTLPSNSLNVANALLYTIEDFGLTGAPGEPDVPTMINWARGMDIKDEDADGNSTESRVSMGDTLHSQPAAVVYGQTDGSVEVVIYTATNSGYLHAVDADSGAEKWSFIPNELLGNLGDLYLNENIDYKNYGLDGDVVPVIYDANNDGVIDSTDDDFVYLVFGMRRGGDNYYMIEVTNPDSPKLRWVRTFPELGQTWSPPVVAKIDINSTTHTSPENAVVVIGGGYDTVHDSPAHPDAADAEGATIMMIDLETGDRIWHAATDNSDLNLAKMTRSIPSRIRVIDLNGDGLADRMYAADLGGQIWRFDITNGAAPGDLVAGGVIARLGAEGLSTPTLADTRRFYTTPDVSIFTDKAQNRRYIAISLGSGYRAHPLEDYVTDRFYSLRDPDLFNPLTQSQYDSYSIIEDDDLTEVSGAYGTSIPLNGGGWKLTLPANEKVLSDSQTFDNSVYFVTLEPTVDSTDPCQAGVSINRLYRLDIVNGDAVIDYGETVPADADDADAARVTQLEQGGIAPKPQFFFPSPVDPNCTGDDCSPPPVACVGVECFDPGFPNFPVRTLWTQDGIE